VTQPPTGLPGSVYNVVTNPNPFAVFDWEYVWHCHILGHEEHDMMRPLILTTRPFAPLYPVAKQTGSPRMVSLTWRDNSRNENRFIVERATDAGFRKDVVQFTVGPHNGTYANPGGLGGTVTYQDVSVTPGKTYHYRVHASNKAGASAWARSAPVKIVK
jgi:FtsP/CotA-like multicopper oxidase with cupredoxin domain